MDKVVIKPEEIEQVMTSLENLMTEISNTAIPAFSAIKAAKFYENGAAEEEVKLLFDATVRDADEITALTQMEADYYGKVQMLATYYSLINEYCLSTLITFQETDAKLAELLEKKITESMGTEGE